VEVKASCPLLRKPPQTTVTSVTPLRNRIEKGFSL
jgi:hypothetical protein